MVKGDNIREAFGAALKEYRTGRGLSQEKLAERAGIDRTYVSLIERGINSVSLISLYKIAHALETDPCALLKLLDKKLEEQSE